MISVRCSINTAQMQDWPRMPCQVETNAPNAISSDAKIYEVCPLKSVNALLVEVTYDDLTREVASFERIQILMP